MNKNLIQSIEALNKGLISQVNLSDYEIALITVNDTEALSNLCNYSYNLFHRKFLYYSSKLEKHTYYSINEIINKKLEILNDFNSIVPKSSIDGIDSGYFLLNQKEISLEEYINKFLNGVFNIDNVDFNNADIKAIIAFYYTSILLLVFTLNIDDKYLDNNFGDIFTNSFIKKIKKLDNSKEIISALENNKNMIDYINNYLKSIFTGLFYGSSNFLMSTLVLFYYSIITNNATMYNTTNIDINNNEYLTEIKVFIENLININSSLSSSYAITSIFKKNEDSIKYPASDYNLDILFAKLINIRNSLKDQCISNTSAIIYSQNSKKETSTIGIIGWVVVCVLAFIILISFSSISTLNNEIDELNNTIESKNEEIDTLTTNYDDILGEYTHKYIKNKLNFFDENVVFVISGYGNIYYSYDCLKQVTSGASSYSYRAYNKEAAISIGYKKGDCASKVHVAE